MSFEEVYSEKSNYDDDIPRIVMNKYKPYLSLVISRKLMRKRVYLCCSGRNIENIKTIIEYDLGIALCKYFSNYYIPVDRIKKETQDLSIVEDVEYIAGSSPNLCTNTSTVSIIDIRRIWSVIKFDMDNLLSDIIEETARKSKPMKVVLEGSIADLSKLQKYNGKNLMNIPLKYISPTIEYILLLCIPR